MINTITPSFAIKIQGDLTPIATWTINIISGGNTITKGNSSLEIEGDILYIRLTQEEYKKIGNSANVQIAVKNSSGVDISDSIRVVWARLSSSVPSSGGGGGGQDGFSPVITITSITGGHRVTVTDANGTQSFNVMDGTDGKDGEDAVLPQIDTFPVKDSTHLITSGGVASAIEDFITTETDPTVPAHVKAITREDIDNWNNGTGGGTEYTVLTTTEQVEQNTEYGKLVDAMVIKEVFQSVSDGKELIALAITGKEIYTSAEDTFAQMAENIGMIQGGSGGEGAVIKRIINFSMPAPEGYPQITTVLLGMFLDEDATIKSFTKANITVTEGQAMENVL